MSFTILLGLNLLTRIDVPNSCPDFAGRAASVFRLKLYSRTESLRLESLEISRAVCRDSLNLRKLGSKTLEMSHHSLDNSKMGRESLDIQSQKSRNHLRDQILVRPDFRDLCLDFGVQILVSSDYRDKRRGSCPDFPDSTAQRDYGGTNHWFW